MDYNISFNMKKFYKFLHEVTESYEFFNRYMYYKMIQYSSCLGTYVHLLKTMFINYQAFIYYEISENEIPELVCKIISHEFFHHIISIDMGRLISLKFDRDWLQKQLQDYGLLTSFDVDKLLDRKVNRT